MSLALALATLSACLEPDDPAVESSDAGAPAITTPASSDGPFECGRLGRVELRDGKVVKDDMVFGFEDELAALCAPEAEDTLFGIGYHTALRKWPNGVIPYRVRSTVPLEIWNRVHQAIAHWQYHTPIRFTTYIEGVHDDWVEFGTGTSCHAEVGRRGNRQQVWLSDDKVATEVRAVAIASNDWVYTWYSDGSVTAGTSTSADAHRPLYKYSLPPGYTTSHIVEIAIAADDDVYTWWSDGKVSIGTTDDLDAHQAPTGDYKVAAGKTRAMIVGIAIGANDTVFTWYNDGTRSVGSSQNLGSFPYAADLAVTPSSIRGIDISSTGAVYTWYSKDSEYRRVTGTLADLATAPSAKVNLPVDCSRGTVIHEIGHAVGLKHEQSRCDRDNYVHVYYQNVIDGQEANFDKECGASFTDYGNYDFYSVMHYPSYGFSKNDSPTLLRKGVLGGNLSGVIDMAISSDDIVYTWWTDGTVTSGTSADLERHRSRYPFTIPGDRTVADIEGIAIASDDRVYTYYVDGTVSVGTTSNLGQHVTPYPYTLAFKAGDVRYEPHEILAVGISKDDNVYVWYEDGYGSWGTSDFPGLHGRYSVGGRVHDISLVRGIDISEDDVVYTWYWTGIASRGSSTNLNSVGTPYAIRGRGIEIVRDDELSNGDIATVNAMY